MCFVSDDYDYIPEVYDVTEGPSDRAFRCRECRQRLPAGAWRHHADARQYECCRLCHDGAFGECDDPDHDHTDGAKCPPGQCSFGDSFTYDRCENCDKVIRAIEAVELARGCHPQESRPNLEELREALDYDEEYVDEARTMFPELAFSGHLDRLVPSDDRPLVLIGGPESLWVDLGGEG